MMEAALSLMPIWPKHRLNCSACGLQASPKGFTLYGFLLTAEQLLLMAMLGDIQFSPKPGALIGFAEFLRVVKESYRQGIARRLFQTAQRIFFFFSFFFFFKEEKNPPQMGEKILDFYSPSKGS